MTVLRDRLTIRPAENPDLKSVLEIYNAGIAERIATFETEPRTIEDISSWSTMASRSASRSTTTRSSAGRGPAPTPTGASTAASASTPSTSIRPPAAADSDAHYSPSSAPNRNGTGSTN